MERHSTGPEVAPAARRKAEPAEEPDTNGRRETPIRPERFARLVTLAGILIDAARNAELLQVSAVCGNLQVSEEELREDIDVLNVVNFGGGSYVLYAEVQATRSRWTPSPTATTSPSRRASCRSRRRRSSRPSTCSATTFPPARWPPRARRSSRRWARTRPARACRSPQPRATTQASPAWSARRSWTTTSSRSTTTRRTRTSSRPAGASSRTT